MSDERQTPVGIIVTVVAVIAVIAYAINRGGGGEQQANNSEGPAKLNQPEKPSQPQKPADLQEPAFLKEGLLVYYPFNGNAKDASGNGNDGNVKGASPAEGRHGKKGYSYNFDGKSWVEVSGLKLDRHSLTFSAWFKTSDKRYVTSMVSQPGGSTTTGTRIGILTSKACFTTGAGNGPTLLSNDAVNDDEWHHLVGSFGKGELHLYVDGELQGFAKFEAEPHFPDESVYIGKEFRLPTTGNDFRYYTGYLDDVRIYNRALAEDQIKALYEWEKPKAE